jgi:hypothetical protein
LLVKKIPPTKIPDLSPVLIPEDAQVGEQDRYGLVDFICAASDCDRFLLKLNPDQPTWATGDGSADDSFVQAAHQDGSVSLVVDQSMVEQVKIEDKQFHVVHQNYVIGVIQD